MALLAKLNININIAAHKQQILLLHHHCQEQPLLTSHRQKRLASLNTAARKPSTILCCQSDSRTILWSDVKVENQRRRTTKWSSLDQATADIILSMHVLCIFVPSIISWGALWTAVGLYIVTGLFGITLSFHRNLAPRSFKLHKWLEYLFAYCGVQALQGNPMDWVGTHRYHHQCCDSDRDRTARSKGSDSTTCAGSSTPPMLYKRDANHLGDLTRQPFYQFLPKTCLTHPIALILSYATRVSLTRTSSDVYGVCLIPIS